MNNTVKLSVIVPTYNHSSYIQKCIESILMQKVDFEYEVLIGDDCSQDDTQNVLKSMEKTLPTNFHIFYREKNLGVGINGNVRDLQSRALGKYIVTIEGDDYLTYEYKFQKQVDYLDANPKCFAVAHNCDVVDEKSNLKDEEYPECKQNLYTYEHYLKGIMPGQLATVMYRGEYFSLETLFFEKYKLYDYFPGDRLKAFLMLTQGEFVCIQEKWSAYRHVTASGTSYSARVRNDGVYKKNEFLFFKSIFEYAKSINDKKAVDITSKKFFSVYIKRCFGKEKICSIYSFFRDIIKEKNTFRNLMYILKSFLMRLKLKFKKCKRKK